MNVRHEQFWGCVSDVVRERLDERAIRRPEILLAPAEQDRRPQLSAHPGCFGGERGLADACFAGDEHHFTAIAGGDAFERVSEDGHLRLTPHHTDGGIAHETRG